MKPATKEVKIETIKVGDFIYNEDYNEDDVEEVVDVLVGNDAVALVFDVYDLYDGIFTAEKGTIVELDQTKLLEKEIQELKATLERQRETIARNTAKEVCFLEALDTIEELILGDHPVAYKFSNASNCIHSAREFTGNVPTPPKPLSDSSLSAPSSTPSIPDHHWRDMHLDVIAASRRAGNRESQQVYTRDDHQKS